MDTEKRVCPNCGEELAEGAAFCPNCETSLVEKAPVDLPKPHSRRLIVTIISALAAIALVAVVLLLRPTPKTYDANGPEINYPAKGGDVHLFLSFPTSEFILPVEHYEQTIVPGEHWGMPSLFFIDSVDPQSFWDNNVKAVSVDTLPQNGDEKMEFSVPAHSDDFADAFLMSEIFFDVECGANDIVWEITMKNGDKVILTQSISTFPKEG